MRRRCRVARIRDLNGLPAWTPFVAESRIEGGQPSTASLRAQFPPQGRRADREQLLTLSDYDYQARTRSSKARWASTTTSPRSS